MARASPEPSSQRRRASTTCVPATRSPRPPRARRPGRHRRRRRRQAVERPPRPVRRYPARQRTGGRPPRWSLDVPGGYLRCTCAGQRPDVPARERRARGAAGRPAPGGAAGRPGAGTWRVRRADDAAGRHPVAVPAAHYAALAAVSALVPGSPTASGAAGASW
jgi:hypothetical protein